VLLFNSLIHGQHLNSGLQNLASKTKTITLSCGAQVKRLGVDHECDRQTDTETDSITIAPVWIWQCMLKMKPATILHNSIINAYSHIHELHIKSAAHNSLIDYW